MTNPSQEPQLISYRLTLRDYKSDDPHALDEDFERAMKRFAAAHEGVELYDITNETVRYGESSE